MKAIQGGWKVQEQGCCKGGQFGRDICRRVIEKVSVELEFHIVKLKSKLQKGCHVLCQNKKYIGVWMVIWLIFVCLT